MRSLRSMVVLISVVFHLAAVFLPAPTHAVSFAMAENPANAQVHAAGHPTDAKSHCARGAEATQHASDPDGAACLTSCNGFQATVHTTTPAPAPGRAECPGPLTDHTLRGLATDTALRPPKHTLLT